MNVKKTLVAGAVLLFAVAAGFAKGDKVLMKVGSSNVTLNEFEYLFHKNSKQQVEVESLEKYVDRYILYKRKVLDAEAAGIDTTSAFKKELEGYKRDLMRPFGEDTVTTERLAHEQYERMKVDVNLSVIAMQRGRTQAETDANMRVADSVYNMLKRGADFGRLARQFSFDRSRSRGGVLGYVRAGQMPYALEKAVFDTPDGEVAAPVITANAIFIPKVLNRREAKGTVQVAHILRLFPRGKVTEADRKAAFEAVEKIYERVMAGEDFAELAKKESDDGSAKDGGMLPWFGPGQMVPEFESVAFTLADGEVSKPFATQYGVHIVKKYASRSLGTYEENRKQIMHMIERDERADMARKVRMESIKSEIGYTQECDLAKFVKNVIEQSEENDSIFASLMIASDQPICRFAGRTVTVGEMSGYLASRKDMIRAPWYDGRVALEIQENIDNMVLEKYLENNSDFNNLYKEYRDGMLLFEISTRRVWGVANDRKDDLEAYFQLHRDRYTWEKPKFKGYILFAKSDSVSALAKERIAQIGIDDIVALAEQLRKEFKSDIRIEKVLAAKGDNQYVDAVAFDGEKIPYPNRRYTDYFVVKGAVISAPEEAADAKMQVTADFQEVLEKEWTAELEKKYPVKLNKKILKQVKQP